MQQHEPAKIPEHEAIYARVRDLILFGEAAPGQALTILGLKDQVGAGMTPVREAIRRLVAEGALNMLENRRLQVPVLRPDAWDQLLYARLAIEPELARRAAIQATSDLADRLEEIDDEVGEAIDRGNIEAYLRYNHRFHFTLYTEAKAPILENMAQALWLRVGPSQRVVCGYFGTRQLPDRHVSCVDALRAGDAEAVAEALREDVQQGMSLIREALIGGG